MSLSDSCRSTMASLLRQALQFAAGSALILEEKSQAFTEEAFKRGKAAQDQGRKLVQEMRAERAQRMPKPVEPRALNVDVALDRRNIPTRSQIQELNQRISELIHRIEEIEEAAE